MSRLHRLAAGTVGMTLAVAAFTSPTTTASALPASAASATPIKHVVVIFQENVSFDHYFGTYPNAANTDGQPFTALPGTPAVDGLTSAAPGGGTFLTHNPNANNPRRYANTTNDVLTCDQDHDYAAEQKAFDKGLMDKFVQTVGNGAGTTPTGAPCVAGDVMNYYDGNTATALWSYAQQYAMSDRSFGTTFGPSAPGAVNLISGDTGGVSKTARNPTVFPAGSFPSLSSDGAGGTTLIGDSQPFYDDCSTRDSVGLSGQNVGDLLNAKGLSWGFFEGGFQATTPYSGPATPAASYDPTAVVGRPVCGAKHNVGVALGAPAGRIDQGTAVGPYGTKADYVQHHQPFQYYASTANPHHLAPASDAVIGTDTATPGQFDTANHQYDMSDFDRLVGDIANHTLSPDHLPAVSFLKAPAYEDGHPAYSDPLDEQRFVVSEINALMKTPDWSSTAVIVSYDDSDGWYDHVYSGVTNPSQQAADSLTGTSQCGTGTTTPGGQQGRCGYGPRLPLLVVSPFAKANFVDHTTTDQSSILKLIEDNWGLGRIAGSFDGVAGSLATMFDFHQAPRPALALDPSTGEVTYPTTLEAHPSLVDIPGRGLTLTLGATLKTATGFPLAGKTVQFSVHGTAVCSATTDLHGDAACGGLIPGALISVLGLGYDATFAGTTFDLPSTAHGNPLHLLISLL